MAPGKKWSATVSAHTRVLLQLGVRGRSAAHPADRHLDQRRVHLRRRRLLAAGRAGRTRGAAAGRASLALRWLRAFGPGTATDLQWWAGWTAATTRQALADCGAVEVTLDEGPGWVAPGDEEPAERGRPVGGAAARARPDDDGLEAARTGTSPASAPTPSTAWATPGPTIWVDGEVVGGWVQAPDGEIRTRLFTDLPAARRAEVDRRAAEVAAMVGETRFTVRFPSPVSAALAAGSPVPG